MSILILQVVGMAHIMTAKTKDKHKLIDDLKSTINRYKLVGGFYFASLSVSFWLGTYYEEGKKNLELIDVRTRQQMELLNQKEQYMEKYFNLREKYIEANSKNYGDKNL